MILSTFRVDSCTHHETPSPFRCSDQPSGCVRIRNLWWPLCEPTPMQRFSRRVFGCHLKEDTRTSRGHIHHPCSTGQPPPADAVDNMLMLVQNGLESLLRPRGAGTTPRGWQRIADGQERCGAARIRPPSPAAHTALAWCRRAPAREVTRGRRRGRASGRRRPCRLRSAAPRSRRS